jgi:pimeloyl-ACP methyl ester carboxylesterase
MFQAMKPVFEELCSEGACAGITSDPLGDIARLAARLHKHALNGYVYDGSGHRHRSTLSTVDLLNLIGAGDLNPALRALLPASVQSALRGDPDPLLRLNLLSEGLIPNLPGTPLQATTPTAGSHHAPMPMPSPVRPVDGSSDGIDEALFVDTTCEETSLPWQRSASPATRTAEALAALRALPASDFYPFDASTAWVDSVLPGCAHWPNVAPAPAAVSPLPSVPTLILSGAQDLRTPTAGAEALAARIPGSQVIVVPYTGHSVLGTDFSGCAQAAVKAFFSSETALPCKAAKNQFSPTPITPTKLALVKAVGGLAGRPGSTLAVVLETIIDLERQVVGATLQADQELPSGSSFGGLRGGFAQITSSALRLHHLSLVNGVQVSGTFPVQNGRLRATDLRVEGSQAAAGTIRVGTSAHVSGTLGGRHFDVNLAKVKLASAHASSAANLPLRTGLGESLRAGFGQPALARLR